MNDYNPFAPRLVARVAKAGIIVGGMTVAIIGDRPVLPGPDLPDAESPFSLSTDPYRDLRTLDFPTSAAATVVISL